MNAISGVMLAPYERKYPGNGGVRYPRQVGRVKCSSDVRSNTSDQQTTTNDNFDYRYGKPYGSYPAVLVRDAYARSLSDFGDGILARGDSRRLAQIFDDFEV